MDRHGLKHRGGIALDGCESISRIQDVIRQAAARTPKGEWIVLMPMGTPPTGYVYRPEQLGESRLGREEALRIATCTGHYLAWEEASRGPLAAGNAADFVVLAEDPLTCDEDRIKDIPVERTFVEGREVFTASRSP